MDKTITGAALLNLDSSGLKDLGIKNKDDREKIKKKIKELKAHNDREKKDMEKEKNKREKLFKKAIMGKKWFDQQRWKKEWFFIWCKDFFSINWFCVPIFFKLWDPLKKMIFGVQIGYFPLHSYYPPIFGIFNQILTII